MTRRSVSVFQRYASEFPLTLLGTYRPWNLNVAEGTFCVHRFVVGPRLARVHTIPVVEFGGQRKGGRRWSWFRRRGEVREGGGRRGVVNASSIRDDVSMTRFLFLSFSFLSSSDEKAWSVRTDLTSIDTSLRVLLPRGSLARLDLISLNFALFPFSHFSLLIFVAMDLSNLLGLNFVFASPCNNKLSALDSLDFKIIFICHG